MSAAIFTHALRDYLRPRRIIPWLLLAGVCLLLAAVWRQLDRTATQADQYAAVSSILVFRLMALASAIFSTAIISGELEGRTIVYLLTRPVPRPLLLLSRYAASVVVVAALGIVSALATSVGAYGVKFLSNPLLGMDIVALIVGAVSYGALFLFVSLIFNRALIICALFAFGWEASIPNLQGDLFRLSVSSYLQAIASHPADAGNRALALFQGSLNAGAISSSQAYMILGSMVLLLLGVGSWWFTHFEFVPREEAE
jgi:ABC-2 type transport system permease protein